MPKILPFFTLTPSASLPSSSANLAVQCTGQPIENAGAASCNTIHWIPPFLGQDSLSIRPSYPKGLDSAAACSGEIVGSVELRNCKQEKNWEETSFFPPLPPFRPPFSFASSTLSRFPHCLRAWKRLVLNWQKAEKERCILKLVLGDFWRSGCEKSMAIIFFSENTGAHIWKI